MSGAASWWGWVSGEQGSCGLPAPSLRLSFCLGIGPVGAACSGKPDTAKGRGRHAPAPEHPGNRVRACHTLLPS